MHLLAELTAGALEDAQAREARVPAAQLRERIAAMGATRDAVAALRGDTVRIIAEVKRASPSKGSLAQIADPAALAALYASGGAAAISVLTEEHRFLGNLDDLAAVRGAVEVPVLRKDFISYEYQLLEARATGADLALLIVAALEPGQLTDLHQAATELGLYPLVEVHDAAEIDTALAAGARILGVNTRDLKDFTMHPERFGELRERIPAGVVAVAESGVREVADVERYRSEGADAVLVGEALVRAHDPRATVAKFAAVR